jgi:hypothetical protein
VECNKKLTLSNYHFSKENLLCRNHYEKAVRNSLIPEKKKSFHKISLEQELNKESLVQEESQPSIMEIYKSKEPKLTKEPSVKKMESFHTIKLEEKVEQEKPNQTLVEEKMIEPIVKKKPFVEEKQNLENNLTPVRVKESQEEDTPDVGVTIKPKEPKPSKYQQEEELEFSSTSGSIHQGDYQNTAEGASLEYSHQATFETDFDEVGALDEFQMDEEEPTDLFEGPFALIKAAITNQENLNNLMPKEPPKNSHGILNIVSRSPTKSTPSSAFETDFDEEEMGYFPREEENELFHTQDGTEVDPDFDEEEMGIVPNEEYFSAFSVTQNTQVDQKKLKKKILKPKKKILSALSPRNNKTKRADALFNVEFQEEEMDYQPKDE